MLHVVRGPTLAPGGPVRRLIGADAAVPVRGALLRGRTGAGSRWAPSRTLSGVDQHGDSLPGDRAPASRTARLLERARRLNPARPRPTFTVQECHDRAVAPAPTDEDGQEPAGNGAPTQPVDRHDRPHSGLQFGSPVALGFLLTTGVGLALVIFTVISANQQLLVWIMASLFIALGLDPIVRRFESWGAPRGVGVSAAVLGLAALLAAFLALLVPTVIDQGTQFVQGLPGTIDEIMASAWFQELDRQFHVQEAIQAQLAGGGAGGDPERLATTFVGIGTALMNAVSSTIVILVLTLYFLASLPHIKYWAYRLAPHSKRARVEYLAEEITSSVGHYVMGQSLVALLNGVVAFIALMIVGAPFPALLAFVAALFAFVPLVGAMLGGILLTLISLTVSWQTAAVFAAIYFLYLQIEAYVVSPRVMRRAVAVPATVAVIAVIAGGTLLGVLGALMAIPTAAAVMLLLREVFIPRQDRR